MFRGKLIQQFANIIKDSDSFYLSLCEPGILASSKNMFHSWLQNGYLEPWVYLTQDLMCITQIIQERIPTPMWH